jgi:hypothetical protein
LVAADWKRRHQRDAYFAFPGDGKTVAIGTVWNAGTSITGDPTGHVSLSKWSGSTCYKVGQDVDGEFVDDSFGYSVAMPYDGKNFEYADREDSVLKSRVGLKTCIYNFTCVSHTCIINEKANSGEYTVRTCTLSNY